MQHEPGHPYIGAYGKQKGLRSPDNNGDFNAIARTHITLYKE